MSTNLLVRPAACLVCACMLSVFLQSAYVNRASRLASTGARPLNSALELDLDFERTTRPPPAPTQESTASLEDLIRCGPDSDTVRNAHFWGGCRNGLTAHGCFDTFQQVQGMCAPACDHAGSDLAVALLATGSCSLQLQTMYRTQLSVCRARVAEKQWDDVIRMAPPPAETRKTALELDDKKSGKVRSVPVMLAVCARAFECSDNAKMILGSLPTSCSGFVLRY